MVHHKGEYSVFPFCMFRGLRNGLLPEQSRAFAAVCRLHFPQAIMQSKAGFCCLCTDAQPSVFREYQKLSNAVPSILMPANHRKAQHPVCAALPDKIGFTFRFNKVCIKPWIIKERILIHIMEIRQALFKQGILEKAEESLFLLPLYPIKHDPHDLSLPLNR